MLVLATVLLVPAAQAATSTYTVKAGDTVSRIVRTYHLNLEALRAVNPGLENPNALKIGQVIRLPVPTLTSSAPSAVTVRPTGLRVGWRLPVQGVVTTAYHVTSKHAGIDLAAPAGTPIVVSRAGQITESRFGARTRWGWTVVVDFGDGSKAH